MALLDWFLNPLFIPLNRIEAKVDALTKKVNEMALDYTALGASLQKITDAETGVKTLLTTLTAEIKDLASKVTDPTAQAQINDFAAQLTAKADALAADVVVNTPAA